MRINARLNARVNVRLNSRVNVMLNCDVVVPNIFLNNVKMNIATS